MIDATKTRRSIPAYLLLLTVVVVCFPAAAGAADRLDHPDPLAPSNIPSLAASVRVRGPLDFCGEPVPLDSRQVRERLEKELMLSLWDRPQVILWLKRSTRYFPLMEKMMAPHQVPPDLKYVSIAESALRPHAGSSKGAVGFWQFIKPTGRRYGLEIDGSVDERRNFVASTQGAIRYFKALYERFHSWTLAAAAYNMGEAGLESEILIQGTNNYYDLYLPLETQRYLFRILSAKIIFSDPKRFGFDLAPNDFYPQLQYDRIQIHLSQQIPVRLAARAADTSFKTIKDLNPEIRGHYLPEGDRSILIPKGAAKGFPARIEQLVGAWRQAREKNLYVVGQGDNLSAIAARFDVPLPALLIWNRLDPKRPIHPGDRLIVAPSE